MSAALWDERKVLRGSAILAFAIEGAILTVAGFHNHWMTHEPLVPVSDSSRFIEAQIFDVPKDEPKLMETKPVAVSKPEATISKVPGKGKPAPAQTTGPEENRTESGSGLAAKHGPIAVFSPQPEIPEYLKSRDIHASVVIDFYVTAQGVTTPRLIGSSGDQELDAIAVATAKRWQFRPAEDNHKVIDAKVRLRILFDVH